MKSKLINWFIGEYQHESHRVKELPSSLVIWGSNLVSSVGHTTFNKYISNSIKLNPYMLSVVVGVLLSDGWLNSNRKNVRLGLKQSLANFKYLWFVFTILSHITKSVPFLVSGVRLDKRLFGVQFNTRSLPCLTELHSKFYHNGVKIIPENIYDLLTPVTLAHWIMGDGAVGKSGLTICTESYTPQEVVRLMNVLKIKYDVDSTVHARGKSFRIYFGKASTVKIYNIVKPHMCDSMLYKIWKDTPRVKIEESEL